MENSVLFRSSNSSITRAGKTGTKGVNPFSPVGLLFVPGKLPHLRSTYWLYSAYWSLPVVFPSFPQRRPSLVAARQSDRIKPI
jgi:hypothetical protein